MDCKLGDFFVFPKRNGYLEIKGDSEKCVPSYRKCNTDHSRVWFIIVVCHVVELWFGNRACGCHSPCVVGVLPCVVNPSPVCGGSFARVWLSIRPCVVEHSPWEEENGPFSVRFDPPHSLYHDA